MSVTIIDIKKESFPLSRLIGKKYTDCTNWSEWWENN